MPQVFQVLRCYKCLVFQIHQTKKSNKWACKLCGEKQSMKRHYGIGTSKDCRMHVQKLNLIRADQNEKVQIDSSFDDDDNDKKNETQMAIIKTDAKSKWLDYLDDDVCDTSIEEPMYLEGTEVVLDLPKTKRKKIKSIKRLSGNSEADDKQLQISGYSCDFKRQKKNFNNYSNLLQSKCFNKPEFSNIQEHCSTDTYETDVDVNVSSKTLNRLSNFELNEHNNETHTNNKSKFTLDRKTERKFEKQNMHSKNVLSGINKNSKWANFIDIVVETVEDTTKNDSYSDLNNKQDNLTITKSNDLLQCNNIIKNKTNLVKPSHSLFTLTNDDNLDEILNI